VYCRCRGDCCSMSCCTQHHVYFDGLFKFDGFFCAQPYPPFARRLFDYLWGQHAILDYACTVRSWCTVHCGVRCGCVCGCMCCWIRHIAILVFASGKVIAAVKLKWVNKSNIDVSKFVRVEECVSCARHFGIRKIPGGTPGTLDIPTLMMQGQTLVTVENDANFILWHCGVDKSTTCFFGCGFYISTCEPC